jgi:acetylcholinesterase
MMLIRNISLCYRKPMQNDTDWPTYTKEHPKYYILNAEKTGIGKGPRTTACAFWNDFLPRLKDHPGELPEKIIPFLTIQVIKPGSEGHTSHIQ